MKRHWIGINKEYVRALCAIGLIVANSTVYGLGLSGYATAMPSIQSRAEKGEYDDVSIDPSKPTEVKDTMFYSVQDGGNYLKFAKSSLPATIAYIQDIAFGPIPKAYRGVEELESKAVFYGGIENLDISCKQGWIWTLDKLNEEQWITIEAHENAVIWVMPTKSEIVDPCEGKPKIDTTIEVTADCRYEFAGDWKTESDTYKHTFKTVEGCDSTVTLILKINKEGCEQDPCEGKTKTKTIKETICDGQEYPFKGQLLTKSGTYYDTLKTAEGCDSIVTLELKVKNCGDMQTVYFCKGMNTEHQDEENNLWYKPFEWKDPKTWFNLSDYQEDGKSDSTLMNLHKAELDLYDYYDEEKGRTPVTQIIWSHRNEAATIYMTVEAANEAQWIPAGVLAVRVLFLCGESYSSDIPTDVVNVEAAQKPVKTIENGQVVIIRGGEKYNILGTRLR